jgi:hypothetical protein
MKIFIMHYATNMQNTHRTKKRKPMALITLFRFITMFYGIDSLMHNIPHIQSECGNIPHNTMSPLIPYWVHFTFKVQNPTSKVQGQWFPPKSGGACKSFRLGPLILYFFLFRGGCPCMYLPPQKKLVGGGLMSTLSNGLRCVLIVHGHP